MLNLRRTQGLSVHELTAVRARGEHTAYAGGQAWCSFHHFIRTEIAAKPFTDGDIILLLAGMSSGCESSIQHV